MMDLCQKCTACLRHCPTGAITSERFLLRAERCITFHNEEPSDVPFPAWLDASWHNCLVGCLHCQSICPENKDYLAWVGEGAKFSAEETALLVEGVPLDPVNLGNTDTIIERTQGTGSPFEPPSDIDVIDIEIVALHLTSTAPVDLTPLGGPFVGVSADLHTTINRGGVIPGLPQPDALNLSLGLMNVFHTVLNGGFFDACWGNVAQCTAFGLGGLGQAGGGIFADAGRRHVGGRLSGRERHL